MRCLMHVAMLIITGDHSENPLDFAGACADGGISSGACIQTHGLKMNARIHVHTPLTVWDVNFDKFQKCEAGAHAQKKELLRMCILAQ